MMNSLIHKTCCFPMMTVQQVVARNTALNDFEILKELFFSSIDRLDLSRFTGTGEYWEEQFMVSISPCDDETASVILNPGSIVLIGRSRKVDIRLKGKNISALHCRIRLDESGTINVMDLCSMIGTRIDGVMLPTMTPIPIHDGQILQIGEYYLTFTKRFRAAEQILDIETIDNPVFFPGGSPPSGTVGFEFVDKSNIGIMKFWIDRSTMISLIAWQFGLARIPVPPPPTMELAGDILIDVFCFAVREKLRAAGITGLSFNEVVSSNPTEQDLLGAEVQMRASDSSWSISIPIWFDFGRESALLSHSDNKMWKRLLKRIVNYESLEIPAYCSLYRCLVSASKWVELMPGDVILTGIHCTGINEGEQSEQKIFFRIGTDEDTFSGFIGHIHRCSGNLVIKLISCLNHGGDFVQTTDSGAWEGKYASSICETRLVDIQHERFIPINVEIGPHALSLMDLIQLQPGMVVNLKQRIGDPLLVKSGDQMIARGRLVDIEGEFGIELTEIIKVLR